MHPSWLIVAAIAAITASSVLRAAEAPVPAGLARWEEFWSFRPVMRPQPPTVQNRQWPANPIDAFVLAKLEAKGMRPAARADRATLIRRLSFDLLGLPPTATEVRAFVSDPSPDEIAWPKLVDRMLASPHYGEKWGRHWLDVARYTPGRISFPGVKHTAGDSAYRDYVVRAFNTDKPFDQFVTEQLAGDLLPPAAERQQQFDQITAPAFLSIGPWFDMCTDPNRLRMEMIDDMINATGKAFLGLSVNCARCHDHKFDPIPTSDYYALAGVFGSTRIVGDFSEYWRDGRSRLLRPLAMPDEVAANERLHAALAQRKAELWEYLSTRRAELMAVWQSQAGDYAAAAAAVATPDIRRFEAEDFDGVFNLRTAELSADGKVVQVIETLNPLLQWVRYKIDVPQSATYRLEALYSADEKCPLTVQVNGVSTTDSALDSATGGWGLQYRRWETVAEFDLHAGLNFLRLTRKEGNFPRIDKFRLVRIDAGFDAAVAKIAADRKLNASLLAGFVKEPGNPWPRVAEIEPLLESAQRKTVEEMTAQMASLQAKIAPHPLVVAVTDQPRPTDMPVHVRGAVEASGPPIPRGPVSLFDAVIPRPAIAPTESGRLQLAHWITDPRNPLTARVIANRVWQWHFGRGIVETASDFGSRGTPPTNPPLLDYLAAELVDARWSIKRLHRLILLSSAYQMSGDVSADVAARDPDNRLLSHFSPRRLEAEELFDAMFSSTNILVHQESGKPLDLQKSLGRGMYVLTTNRAPPGLGGDVRKMFALFDLDLSGATIDRRPQSGTAAQSLFWLNSPLPHYYAGRFAERLLKMEKLTDAKRLEQAYWIAYAHPPDEQIARATLDYLDLLQSQGSSRQEAWSQVCLAIFASNEFHYVE